MSVTDDIPDDILQLVLERKKREAIEALRREIGCGLQVAVSAITAAEDELGMTERVECVSCGGTGKARVYKPEYQKP